MMMGGSWSAYWYNGVIVSSEIARGLDIYELVPSGLVTENELAAAKTVKTPYRNTQDQQKIVWVPSFALARAYLDQLERSKGLAAETIATARTTLASAERSGSQRKAALTQLAAQLNTAAAGARSGQGAGPLHRGRRSGEREAVTRAATKARSHEGSDVLRVSCFRGDPRGAD